MIFTKEEVQQLFISIKRKANNDVLSLLQKVQHPRDLDNDDSGSKLVHYSVNHNNPEILQHLIEIGCNINSQDSSGFTPLMKAVKGRNPKMVEILLKNNADIFFSRNGKNSLQLCVEEIMIHGGSYIDAIFDLFIDKLNKDFPTNRFAIAPLLNSDDTVKLTIVGSGSIDLARFILANGYDIDYYEPSKKLAAIHWAVKLGKLENIKMLIERGARLRSSSFTLSPLYFYVPISEQLDEHKEVLKTLIKACWIDVNEQERYLVEKEVENLLQNGNKETVRTVLQCNLNLFSVDFSLTQPLLHYLILNKNDDVLDLFDELGINFNANEVFLNGTALTIAIISGSLIKIEFLLKHDADVNLIISNGRSPLYVAFEEMTAKPELQSNSEKIVELLLQYGANAQFKTCHGRFVIDISLRHRKEFATKVLIAHLAILGAMEPSKLLDTNLIKITTNLTLNSYFDNFTRRLEEMKIVKMHENVTLFNILSQSDKKLVTYTRNPEFILAFKKIMKDRAELETYYSNFLTFRVTKAINRSELERKAATAIESLTGICSDVYFHIVEKIFCFLSDYDLSSLYKAESLML